MEHATLKTPRSVRLTKKEVATLKAYRKGFTSNTQAAISIGIDREILNRILVYGSGSPLTVKKIREKLNSL